MDQEEIEIIIKFIKYCQETLTREFVAKTAPQIEQNSYSPAGSTSTYEYHLARLEQEDQGLREMMGDDYVEKMWQLLEERKDFLKNAKEFFINQDFNTSNFIRTPAGKINIVDWERLKLIPNEAAAYTYLITSHWQHPETQNHIIKKVLEESSGSQDFKELMRLDLIFFRYSRIAYMYYWKTLKNPDAPPEKKEKARQAVNRFSELIKEAIDEKGIWSNQSN